jgi:flagellar export protein FliJ
MKKFHWRMQRLLDLKSQQEQALRAELMGLMQEMLNLRQRIISIQDRLRHMMDEVNKWPVEQRIGQQEAIMRCIESCECRIRALEEQLQETRQKRQVKSDELMQARASRQTLERMREDARRDYMRAELAKEQKQLDDGAQVTFTRKRRQAIESKAG